MNYHSDEYLNPAEVEEFLASYHEAGYRYTTRGKAGGTMKSPTRADILAYDGGRFADGAYADTRLPSERMGDEVMDAAFAGEDVANAVMREHWALKRALKKWSAEAIACIITRDHAKELKQAEAHILKHKALKGEEWRVVRTAAKFGDANAIYLRARHLELRKRARRAA